MKPWDGVWRVERPASFTPGLYRLHQATAFHLLRHYGLNEWAANFLQVIAYKSSDLTLSQRYWLRRLDDESTGRRAA